MMKALRTLLFLAIMGYLVLFLASCLEENFIPDPSDPRLPKYTESGNQVAGALVNDIAWKTNFSSGFNFTDRSFYFTIYSTGDSVTLHLDGAFTEGINNEAPISFIVVLKNIPLKNLEDIKTLERQSINLDGNTNYVVLDDRHSTIQDTVEYYYGGTGAITFRQVKPVTSTTLTRQNGEKYHPLIVAGTFKFDFQQHSILVTMGRFDFYINDAYLDRI